MRQLGTVKKIIVHCSLSDFGDAKAIDQWHRDRNPPFDMIGYHYVITNGVFASARPYEQSLDGLVQVGRPLDKEGAHCYGHNRNSIGICLIGKHTFTGRQIFTALPDLLIQLLKKFKLNIKDIYGHREIDKTRTCPNLDMDRVREFVRQRVAVKILKGDKL